LSAAQRNARRKAKAVKGYATQAERFAKLQRFAASARQTGPRAGRPLRRPGSCGRGRGKRLAHARQHLDEAGLSTDQWRERWEAARYRITANGSPEEPFGNLTITVTPAGEVSLRLPKPLEHLANAARAATCCRGWRCVSHRGEEWTQRITSGNSVSYALSRKPGRGGRYLSACWAIPAVPYWVGREDCGAGDDVYADGPVVGVDLNYGHLAIRRMDAHGNPVGAAERIDFDLTGRASHRDAQLRHAITRLLHYTRCHHITTGLRGRPRLRRRPRHRTGKPGSREAGKTIPPHRVGNTHRGVSQPTRRYGLPHRYRPDGGQSRLQQHLGCPALAAPLQQRHPTSGSRNGDR